MQVINTKKKMKKKKYANSGTVSVAKKHSHSTMPLRTPSLLPTAGQVMLRLSCFIQCNMRNSQTRCKSLKTFIKKLTDLFTAACGHLHVALDNYVIVTKVAVISAS